VTPLIVTLAGTIVFEETKEFVGTVIVHTDAGLLELVEVQAAVELPTVKVGVAGAHEEPFSSSRTWTIATTTLSVW
jgi:hypothetical protein